MPVPLTRHDSLGVVFFLHHRGSRDRLKMDWEKFSFFVEDIPITTVNIRYFQQNVHCNPVKHSKLYFCNTVPRLDKQGHYAIYL